MCGWFPRSPLPLDLKEWTFMELKKEMHKLSGNYLTRDNEEGRLQAVTKELDRRSTNKYNL